jgi:Uma2 family endonuclease
MLGAHPAAGSTLITPARKLTPMSSHGARAASLAHLRAPVPLRFPESADMPEGYDHVILRTFLFQLLGYLLGAEHSVGSEQFVYWLPTNPRRCLSPDVLVKLGVAQTRFGSWKCWEHGAPDLAIEIISPNEGDGMAWDEKVARYAELGVEELLRFDPEEAPGRRLRAWDRIEGDFVERTVAGDDTPCVTLALHWVVCPVSGLPVGVRLADDEGTVLATREEALDAARMAAEARVEELEEELRRRG